MDFAAGHYGGVADMGHGFDGHSVFVESEASASKDFFITAGVQVGKAIGKFDILPVGSDGAEGAFAFFQLADGYVVHVNRQKPPHARTFVFEVASSLGGSVEVHGVALYCPKYIVQHVVEVHANVGGDAA